MTDIEVLGRRVARERAARLEAERLLEAKSTELFEAMCEMRKTVDENRATVRFLNAVVDHMPVGLCLTDLKGRLKMANPAAREMLSVKTEVLAETDMQQFFPDVRLERMRAGVPFDMEMKRTDGVAIQVEMVVSALFQGTSSSFIWLLSDISERRRSEERQKRLEGELREAHKMEALGVLSAGVAHEINTPLQYARDNLNFVREALTAANEAMEEVKPRLDQEVANETWSRFDLEFHAAEGPKAIQDALEGLDRVSDIVKAIKEFAHPSGATMQPNDLNKLVVNAVMVSKNHWKYAAEVETELSDQLPLLECCGGEIGQVILNLVGNAADAIAENKRDGRGQIKISTRLQGDHIEIVVADNGPGIPDNILPRIFDPFFTTKEPGKGSGQGLAICHTIVTRNHGGSITAGNNLAGGAAFQIRLPIRLNTAAAA